MVDDVLTALFEAWVADIESVPFPDLTILESQR